jgi:CubicO group peptidase (beta-lactamase class C family)
MLPYTEIQFEPGSRSSYSNPAIIFLGRIIEILAGDDYEVYVDKNILKPLGMHASYFDVTPYHLLKDRSNNYLMREGLPEAQGLDFDTGITTSNSGLNASIPDMVRYLAFLAGSAPAGPAASVLSRASLDEMFTAQIGITPDSTQATTRESMGLIFFLLDFADRRYAGHTGSQKAFQSFFYVDPAAGTAAIAAFNTDAAGSPRRPDTRAILTGLRTRLFESVFPLWPAKGSRKNSFPELAPGFESDWAGPSEQDRRRSRSYVEDLENEERPRMARRWDAKMGSYSCVSPLSTRRCER